MSSPIMGSLSGVDQIFSFTSSNQSLFISMNSHFHISLTHVKSDSRNGVHFPVFCPAIRHEKDSGFVV